MIEYWIVDPVQRSIAVNPFAPLRKRSVFGSGAVFESVALSGLRVDVDDGFASP